MRSIMPGHVNYYYKEGIPPTHTKPEFSSYNILTVQNIILKNMMIFINKAFNFPTTLPLFVRQSVPTNIPIPSTSPDYHSAWYESFNSFPYNKTVFFKAPLFYYHIMTENSNLRSCKTQNAYKRHIKSYLLQVQSTGDKEEWHNSNFMLTSIKGLRQSNRLNSRDEG